MTKLLLGSTEFSVSTISNNTFILGRFACLFSGSVQYIYARYSGITKAKVAIYADSAGSPGALLVASDEANCVAGWNAISLSPTIVTKDVYYWLAMIYESGVSRFYGAAGTGAQCYKAATYSDFSFPNPAGTGFTANTRAIAEYGYGSDVVVGVGLVGDGLVFSEEGGGRIIG